MPFPIQDKFVVAIASSALFDLSESDAVFKEGDLEEYREYQLQHEDEPLEQGPAFPFIRRLLSLNEAFEGEPIEVVLLSRNDADSGLRVMNSMEALGLGITRAAFLDGGDPWRYMESFNCSLFLSGNMSDVRGALDNGLAAGHILKTEFEDDEMDSELRIAFDFDGVLADDEAENVNQQKGLERFIEHETTKAEIPLAPGPLMSFLDRIRDLQQAEREKQKSDPTYEPRIRTAIVTARNAPAHKRVIHTLRAWGLQVDQSFFLGGMDKKRVLREFRPHIFFDDQQLHVEGAAGVVPSVHIPFGELNKIVDAAEGVGTDPDPA